MIVLRNITEDDDGSVEENTWRCNLGSGDINVRVIVAVHGSLYWEDNENFMTGNSVLVPSLSVSQNILGEGKIVQEIAFVPGRNISLTCIAKNTKPEGRFVWRIGNRTLRNRNPLELDDINGNFLVKQTLEFRPRTDMNDNSVFCFLLQLDHRGKVIFTDVIEARMLMQSKKPLSSTIGETVSPAPTVVESTTIKSRRIHWSQRQLYILQQQLVQMAIDTSIRVASMQQGGVCLGGRGSLASNCQQYTGKDLHCSSVARQLLILGVWFTEPLRITARARHRSLSSKSG